MDKGDKMEDQEKLKEIVWCDHLGVKPQFLTMVGTPHAHVKGSCYVVVEENKVKLICDHCFIQSARTLKLPF